MVNASATAIIGLIDQVYYLVAILTIGFLFKSLVKLFDRYSDIKCAKELPKKCVALKKGAFKEITDKASKKSDSNKSDFFLTKSLTAGALKKSGIDRADSEHPDEPMSATKKRSQSPSQKPRRKRTLSSNFILESNSKQVAVSKARHKKKNVTKICFTGGPSAGKTTAISSLSEYLRDLGHLVLCVPNAEKIILNSVGVEGLSKTNTTLKSKSSRINLAVNQMQIQLHLEQNFNDIIVQNPNVADQELFLMIENGVLDNKPKFTDSEWERVMVAVGMKEAELYRQYDLVIHMVTAADGASSHFNQLNLTEMTLQESIRVDENLRAAYMNHPGFYMVCNREGQNFSDKINIAKNFVLTKVLDYPSATQFHCKWLLDNQGSNSDLFDKMVEKFGTNVVDIEDIILASSEGECKYVRKRIDNGMSTFLKGLRVYKGIAKRVSTKRNITLTEYLNWKKQGAATESGVSTRRRTTIMIEQRYPRAC
jgi:hypothetical protein